MLNKFIGQYIDVPHDQGTLYFGLYNLKLHPLFLELVPFGKIETLE